MEMPPKDLLDVLSKIATIAIGVVNIFIAVKVLLFNRKKNTADRKLQLIKTLIFDHALIHFYESFESVERLTEQLKSTTITTEEKSNIDSLIQTEFSKVRAKFYDLLLCVDIHLYENIMEYNDDLQKKLTDNIFNQGVNLSHPPMFESLIHDSIATTKQKIIQALYNYN